MRTDPSVVSKAEECFLALLDEGLSYSECQAWIRWLNQKPDHQDAYDQIARLWSALDRIDPKSLRLSADSDNGTFQVPGHFSNQVPLARTKDAPRIGVSRSWPAWLPVATVCTLVASVVVGIFYFDRFFGQNEVLETKVAQMQAFKLADGTIARLAGDTRIETNYSANERRVRLVRGEAFFSVSKDANRPFIVLAGSGEAKALGTRFDVNKLEQVVTVTVEEGLVQVSGNSGEKNLSSAELPQSTTIGLGESVSYSDKKLRPVEKVNLKYALAWRNGTLILLNQPLAEAIEQINRYSKMRILFRPNEIAGLTVSGTVNLSQTDDWLKGLEKGYSSLKVVSGGPDMLLLTRTEVSPPILPDSKLKNRYRN